MEMAKTNIELDNLDAAQRVVIHILPSLWNSALCSLVSGLWSPTRPTRQANNCTDEYLDAFKRPFELGQRVTHLLRYVNEMFEQLP